MMMMMMMMMGTPVIARWRHDTCTECRDVACTTRVSDRPTVVDDTLQRRNVTQSRLALYACLTKFPKPVDFV